MTITVKYFQAGTRKLKEVEFSSRKEWLDWTFANNHLEVYDVKTKLS